MRQLFTIRILKANGKELAKMRKKHKKDSHCLSLLPEYCIRENNGAFDYTEYYLQFVDEHSPKEEYYYLVDFINMDAYLNQEFKEIGLDLFNEIDFRPALEFLNINTLEDFQMAFPENTHLIMDVEYTGQGEDVEVDISLVGYLDAVMKFNKL